LSLLSAKTAGQAGPNRITQAVFSTSTWYVFAGQVTGPISRASTVQFLGFTPDPRLRWANIQPALTALPLAWRKQEKLLHNLGSARPANWR
jgi:hypothetical protein